MKKWIKMLCMVSVIGMLMMSSLAYAYDGTKSCSFKTDGGITGTGILTVNSSKIVASSTLKGYQVRTVLNYGFTNSVGQIKVGMPEDRGTGTISIEVKMPSGSFNRYAISSHKAVNHQNTGYCNLKG